MKHAIAAFLFVLILAGKPILANSDETRQLLLVTGAHSDISSLSASETRRLFLGFPITKNGHQLEAAINHSDPFLYEVFLQKIVYMSSPAYERHLLTNVIQLGGQRPQSFDDTRSLINTLKESPGTITLLWDKDVRNHPNLVILGEVWHGTVE